MAPKSKIPKAPAHLRPESRRWWDEIVSEFCLEPHHLKVLQLACEAWDRACEAREALKRHGLTYADARGFPRPRPEAAIARDSAVCFARLVRELNLGVCPNNGLRAIV